MARPYAATRTGGRGTARTVDDSNVLGSTLRVRGRVSGDSDLRIEGEVEGDVAVRGALEIGSGGTVSGNVTAESVVLAGNLTGDVQSEGAVVIRSGAKVFGNMNGSEVSLEEGAAFRGRIEAEFELPDGLGGSSAPARKTSRR